MQVRVFDENENDVTASGGPGRSACKGPGITPGYFANPEANAQLFRDDGWMYLGDIIEIDPEGYLRVVGRTADFIIRGGHNVSAPAVEEQILTYRRVAMAAVVGMPDPVLGERVCAYVVTSDGAELRVDELSGYLAGRGVSKTMWPERLICVPALPTAGGKVAKSALRADVTRRIEEERIGEPASGIGSSPADAGA
jgi:acyl-CoA synthetase